MVHPGEGFGGDRRLRSCQRLKRTADFQTVYDARKAIHSSSVVIFYSPNGLPFSRLGVSVGRKHGHAPRRSRIKRVLREAFRHARDRMPAGYDYILVPRRGVERFKSAEVRGTLEELAKRIPLPREGQRLAEARTPGGEGAGGGGKTPPERPVVGPAAGTQRKGTSRSSSSKRSNKKP